MPIKSYLALPFDGQRNQLVQTLKTIEGCELIPADNHELIVIVCDTPSDEQDKALFNKINAIDSLQMLSMVSGFDDNTN